MKIVDVTMCTQKEDDEGLAPIVLHVMGPKFGTKVYARLTLAEATKVYEGVQRAVAEHILAASPRGE